MSGTAWDQEFFRRRAAGEQEPGRAQEPTAATPLAPGHTEASAQDRAEFSRRYGCPLLESYGSSEGTCYIICTPGTPEGALGVPQQGFAVEIVSTLGEVCPAARFDASGVMLNPEEAIGEIVSRGAAARFEGYYKNPAASLDRLRDGDFWTGDLGYRDENGFYWFAGRTADWLRVDSENFAAPPSSGS